MRKYPPRSASRSEAKMLGLSKRGLQNQSMTPSVLTSAAVWRSPIRPCSAMAGYLANSVTDLGCWSCSIAMFVLLCHRAFGHVAGSEGVAIRRIAVFLTLMVVALVVRRRVAEVGH